MRKRDGKRPSSVKDGLDLAKHPKKEKNKFFVLLIGQV